MLNVPWYSLYYQNPYFLAEVGESHYRAFYEARKATAEALFLPPQWTLLWQKAWFTAINALLFEIFMLTTTELLMINWITWSHCPGPPQQLERSSTDLPYRSRTAPPKDRNPWNDRSCCNRSQTALKPLRYFPDGSKGKELEERYQRFKCWN